MAVTVAGRLVGATRGRGFTGVTVFTAKTGWTGCCRLKLGAMPMRLEERR